MSEQDERKFLSTILLEIKAAELVRANKLRGLPTATHKDKAIRQLEQDIGSEARNRELCKRISPAALAVLQNFARSTSEQAYTVSEAQLIRENGYLNPEKLLDELETILMLIPMPPGFQPVASESLSDFRGTRKTNAPSYRYNAPGSIYSHKAGKYGYNVSDFIYRPNSSVLWCPSWVKSVVAQVEDSGQSEDTTPRLLVAAKSHEMKLPASLSIVPASALDIIEDLFSFLRYVQKKQVRITQSHSFPRVDEKKIVSQFHNQDKLWGKTSLSYFFFVNALAARDGLFVINQTTKYLEVADLDESCRQSVLEKVRNFCKYWLEERIWDEMQRIPGLTIYSPYAWEYGYDFRHHVGYPKYLPSARATIWYLLSKLPAQEWISLEYLQNEIRKQKPGFLFAESEGQTYHSRQTYYNVYEQDPGKFYRKELQLGQDWHKVEGRFIEKVVAEPLFWFGIVDVAQSANDASVVAFRITDFGATILGIKPAQSPQETATPCLIVQSDFEIIVYKDKATTDILWVLAQIAELLSSQQIARYKLTRHSFLESLNKGHSLTKLVEFLQKNGQTEIPQNVLYTLKEWAAQHEKIRLWADTTVLELESAEMVETLLQQTDFQDKILQRLSATTVQINAQAAPAMLKWLQTRHHSVIQCSYAFSQPNTVVPGNGMKILLPFPEQHPYEQHKLKQFAELLETKSDYQLYQLTPESFKRGKSYGLGAQKIMDWLTGHRVSSLPISADFIITMSNWGRESLVLPMSKAYMIRNPQGILHELAFIPELAALMFVSMDGLTALVDEANLPCLEEELQKRNITLRTESLPTLLQVKQTPFTPDSGESLWKKYQSLFKTGKRKK